MSLDSFPPPQPFNSRTLRESGQTLHEGLEDYVVIDDTIVYPSINIKADDIIKPSVTREAVENIFIIRETKFYKQFIRCLRRKGFLASLQLICDYDYNPEVRNYWSVWLLTKTAQLLLDLWTLILAIYVFFYPYAMKSNEELCQEFNKSMDWKNGLIRAFEWHPNIVRCALCLVNDSIYIYSADSKVPLLKHPLQSKVTAISWNPIREDMLAVCCETSVLIWTVEFHSKQYGSRSENVKVINTGIPVPLTDIKFDPSGQYLVTCSPQSSKLIIIDLAKTPEEVTAVRQFGTCFTRLLWSPDNSQLLCLTTSNNMRIFNNKSWSSTKLQNKFAGVIQCAVWSRPKNHIVLIAPRDSSEVYALFFHHSVEATDTGSSRAFHKVLDLTEFEFSNGVKVGGKVHDMVWDKKSERLAISFKENQQYIALYKTVIRSNLEITAIGFVHGLINEFPLLMTFHDSFKNGSLLTICWSSGVISYIPLEFDKNANQSIYANGTPRPLTSFCVSPLNRKSSDNFSSTPMRTPLRESNGNRMGTPLLNMSSNESALSPRRPTLFSTLSKNTIY